MRDTTAQMQLSAIRVGERHRCKLGDIDSLAASIANVGLLHPIVIAPDGLLIAGQRRLEACRHLGWTEVPVRVVEDFHAAETLLIAERDENVCRLDMTNYEKIMLGRALERLERSKAEERRLEGNARGGRTEVGDKRPPTSYRGRTREIVGHAIGLSGASYDRGRQVVDLAEAGKPEAVEALADLKSTGKVTPAWVKATGSPHYQHPRRSKPPRDKLRELLRPVDRYLKDWDESTLSGMTPAQARQLLPVVQRIDAALFEVERALESRATVSRALR
jgi:ParB-like chromosome segregation protein Spo0J